MNDQVKRVMHQCTAGSLDGSLSFPEVVSNLTAVGCEQYHADLRRQEKTYYMPDGDSHVETLHLECEPIAEAFSPHDVVAALRAVQSGKVNYVAFLQRIRRAGCVGYTVHIPGRRAIYLGRHGDLCVEYMPNDATSSVTSAAAGR